MRNEQRIIVKEKTNVRNLTKDTFDEDLAEGALVSVPEIKFNDPLYSAENLVDGNSATFWMPVETRKTAVIELDLNKRKEFNTIVLQEYIPKGQRIEAFQVEFWDGFKWVEMVRSTTVGYKRILRFDQVSAQKLRIKINKSRQCPALSGIGIYLGPELR